MGHSCGHVGRCRHEDHGHGHGHGLGHDTPCLDVNELPGIPINKWVPLPIELPLIYACVLPLDILTLLLMFDKMFTGLARHTHPKETSFSQRQKQTISPGH
jgi:hypothetical protein